MIRRRTLWVLACALASASSLRAQEGTSDLRLKLSAPDGSPIAGALVALVNASDSVVVEGLTLEAGTRVLRAPRGAYRVRVRRIGYLPFLSSELTLPRPEELVLNVESQHVVLASIVVTSRSECSRNDPNTEALATVWDEIDKALRSSQLTVQDLAGIGQARVYKRETAPDGKLVASESRVFAITTRRPFGAVDPAKLAADGYVIGGLEQGWTFFGPDETVLRSEEFARTHCFKLVRDRDRTGQIGVSFEPEPQRRLPDISGTIWVDQSTSELREMEFQYVNAHEISRFNAGGFTKFRRVASGAWLVDEWKLSVPMLGIRETQGVPYATRHVVLLGRQDNGGGIVRQQ